MKRRTFLLIVLTAILLVPASLWAQETVPPAPILTANHEERTVRISWDPVPGAARYELFAWDRPNGWQKLDDGSLTATSFEQSELEANVQYYYTYRAHYSSGDVGAWSVYSSIVIAPPLRAPVLTAVLDGTAVSLSWGEVAEGTKYELWVWNSVTKWKRLEDSFSGTTFRHENVVSGTTYYYTARAQDSAGKYSTWSEYAIVEVSDSTAATATPTVTPNATLSPTPTQTLTTTPTSTPSATPTATIVIQEDRDVLVVFYNSTKGAKWKTSANWLSDLPLTRWYGVATESLNSRVVIGLQLEDNDVSGHLPPELGELASLRWLYLQQPRSSTRFRLSGSIPSELGKLTNLRSLGLNFNLLTGAIPPELGNLTNLEVMFLNHNRLSGSIPPELGNLSNLSILSLQRNRLTGSIPAELGNLTNLTSLSLGDGNDLTGTIPPQLGNLTNLISLSLRGSSLTGTIPAELGQLTNLTYLDLSANNLTGTIPAELGNLTNLTSLSLRGNNLTGSIPAELGQLPRLKSLYLSGNDLTGCIPPALHELNNDLGQLNLPDCQE